MCELSEFKNAKEIRTGRTGVIVDKAWYKDLNDFGYILEYDDPQDTDRCGCISDVLTADELELIQ
ncbi:MAG: hypothetical protein ACI3VX_03455 [Faecousia sp.]